MRFFKDSKGRLVIWQRPNIPLIGWLFFKFLSTIVHSKQSNFSNVSTAFLFTWAYLEIASGKSYFRRVLGAVIMAAVLVGYLK